MATNKALINLAAYRYKFQSLGNKFQSRLMNLFRKITVAVLKISQMPQETEILYDLRK